MPGSNTHITQIAQALVAKHAAVMVGAGFSRNADKKYSTNREFLDWKKLSDLFYDKLYEDGAGPGKMYASSLGLAEQVERLMGRPVLEEILHQAVPDEDYIPSELFRKLMELPWRDVFTTNYDTLLERTADQITKRRYNVVVCKEDLAGSNDAVKNCKTSWLFSLKQTVYHNRRRLPYISGKICSDGEYSPAGISRKCVLHDRLFRRRS